jgi:hypothetical protein
MNAAQSRAAAPVITSDSPDNPLQHVVGLEAAAAVEGPHQQVH